MTYGISDPHPASRRLVAVLVLAATVSSLAVSARASTTISYDAVGRVAAVLYDNGLCLAYTYDASGNRTSRVATASGSTAATWGTGTFGCFSWSP